MAFPVVVSRIQNRRGTQAQFDVLYPAGYKGVGGYGSLPGFNATTYPNVLQPGEIALCTDSRRMFTGNLNAEFVEILLADSDGIKLIPLTIILPPAPLVPTLIPQLTYLPTNFFTFLYDVTDAPPDLPPPNTTPGVPGPTFSRNGEMKVTAIVSPMVPAPPVPPFPFPPITPVTLTDISVDINLTPAFDISFTAQYDNNLAPANIRIFYTHTFPGNLVFSTSSIQWV